MGIRFQERLRKGDTDLILPIIAYYGTGRLWDYHKEKLLTIYYDINGKIFAGDEDVHFDLVDTLNLNCDTAPIVEERRNALETLINEIGEAEEDLRVYCEMLLEGFESETDSKTPYVGILIWYLKDFIAMLSGE